MTAQGDKPTWISGALVVAAAALVHGRSIAFDFTALDDRDFIVDDHAFLARLSNLPRAFTRSYMHVLDPEHPYYRPLVTVSYGLDAQWSGTRAFGYHLTNVVLHAVAGLLFLALLRRFALGPAISLGGALLLVVHPALAAAVAWIPGRNDSLLAVFALGAWLLFMRDLVRPSWPSRLFHVVLYWLALLTKETAVAIPLVCAAHLVHAHWRRSLATWRLNARWLFLSGGWAVGIVGRLLVHPHPGDIAIGGAVRNLPLLAAGLGQIVLPVNPSAFAVAQDLPVWPGLVAGVLLAAAARWVPGVRRRVVVLGAAAFALFLGPALLAAGSLALSSRLYLPACGAILAIAEIVRALAPERRVLVAFSAVTLVALGAITLAFEGTFRNRRAFAHGAVAASPHSPLSHLCLGQTYQIDGDLDRALAEYRVSLALGAAYVVHNNIAVIHMASARWTDAEGELREDLALDPGDARAYRNLAIVFSREGRLEEARAAGDRARELTTK